MGLNRKEPQVTLDLYLKQGSDLSQTIPWSPGGALVNFAGAAARMPLVVDGQGDVLGLSTTASLYGGLTLVSAAGSTPAQIALVITKAATQALRSVRSVRSRMSFYVDWPDGTTTCLFSGTAYLSPGSPF